LQQQAESNTQINNNKIQRINPEYNNNKQTHAHKTKIPKLNINNRENTGKTTDKQQTDLKYIV
jgi:hypothetical protein